MNLVTEIVELLGSPDCKLEDALVKTKVLMHRVGEVAYAEWVNKELNGYAPKDDVPEYRRLHLQVKLIASDGLRTWNDMPAPTMHLEEKWRRRFEKVELRQSISELEILAKSEGTLTSTIEPEFWHLFSKPLTKGVQIQYARGEMSAAQVRGALTAIRSKLLDFVLGLESKLPKNASADEAIASSKSLPVGEMFKNAMFGDNATILLGNNNTQVVNATKSVVKNDLDSLIAFLREHSVEERDLEDLKEAIRDDGAAPAPKGRFGARVSAWIGQVMGKIAAAGAQIELGITANLITAALQAYYGN